MHDCVETAESVLKTAEKCADYCMKCVETAENVLKQQKNVLNKECSTAENVLKQQKNVKKKKNVKTADACAGAAEKVLKIV